MTPRDLIDDLRSRINPVYAAQLGTESYERRLCAEALEAQADEIDRLRADASESDALREKMAGLLSSTAVALRGPEPPMTRWSWHDLPDRAAAAIAAIDVMQRVAVMAAQDSPPNTRFMTTPVELKLATRMGMTGSVLRNKADPKKDCNKPLLVDADRAMALAGDTRILDALAQAHGGVFIKVDASAPASDLAVLELVTHVWRSNGDVGSAVDDALADGKER